MATNETKRSYTHMHVTAKKKYLVFTLRFQIDDSYMCLDCDVAFVLAS